jgi:hypothetical protein
MEIRGVAMGQVIEGQCHVLEGARSLEMSDTPLADWVSSAHKCRPMVKRTPMNPVNDVLAEPARLLQESTRFKIENAICKYAKMN